MKPQNEVPKTGDKRGGKQNAKSVKREKAGSGRGRRADPICVLGHRADPELARSESLNQKV